MMTTTKTWELPASSESISACFLRVCVWFNGYCLFLIMLAVSGDVCSRRQWALSLWSDYKRGHRGCFWETTLLTSWHQWGDKKVSPFQLLPVTRIDLSLIHLWFQSIALLKVITILTSGTIISMLFWPFFVFTREHGNNMDSGARRCSFTSWFLYSLAVCILAQVTSWLCACFLHLP